MHSLPRTENNDTINRLNRANHFRRQGEFDKAMDIYEELLSRFDDDPEIYWSIVLCRYGIEYVDDPLTGKKIPTCHRTQYTPILNDEDYLSALKYADPQQEELYRSEAEYINGVQKSILSISNKEEPFDVFICYKELDENGERTPDSVLAQELYYDLTKEGLKVFFARITLERKLGTAYEPYIFAALNSSKVMVVIGTRSEHFNAVWVKNEWSRYLILQKNDRGKTLIPAYKDMSPYDLPDALSILQAQDMSKVGARQDLVYGICKLAKTGSVQNDNKKIPDNDNAENILKRGMISLEDEKWIDANSFFEQVLNLNVEEGRAYLGKLLVDLKLKNERELEALYASFADNDNYRKALRFGDEALVRKLRRCNDQAIYNGAVKNMEAASSEEEYQNVSQVFDSLGDFSDSAVRAEKCRDKAMEIHYDKAMKAMSEAESESDFKNASSLFHDIFVYRDSADKERLCLEMAEDARKGDIERQVKLRKIKRRSLILMPVPAVFAAVIMPVAGALVSFLPESDIFNTFVITCLFIILFILTAVFWGLARKLERTRRSLQRPPATNYIYRIMAILSFIWIELIVYDVSLSVTSWIKFGPYCIFFTLMYPFLFLCSVLAGERRKTLRLICMLIPLEFVALMISFESIFLNYIKSTAVNSVISACLIIVLSALSAICWGGVRCLDSIRRSDAKSTDNKYLYPMIVIPSFLIAEFVVIMICVAIAEHLDSDLYAFFWSIVYLVVAAGSVFVGEMIGKLRTPKKQDTDTDDGSYS